MPGGRSIHLQITLIEQEGKNAIRDSPVFVKGSIDPGQDNSLRVCTCSHPIRFPAVSSPGVWL